MNTHHLRWIHRLFDAADADSLPLWLQGGWAIDARLGRITREHEDIDIAFPADREPEFHALLARFGGTIDEATDYGFLGTLDGVLIDCEPCLRHGDVYELEGPPAGNCPSGKQGVLDGRPVRCTSWEAVLWDYFYYLIEVPTARWREKDFISYALAREAYGEAESERLHARFRREVGDGAPR